MAEKDTKNDDEVVVDFSKLKNIFKKKTATSDKGESKQHKTEEHHNSHHLTESHKEHPEQHHKTETKKESTEEFSLDFNEVKNFGKKHAKWIIPLLCILIAMSFSIYLRTMPTRLPITDDWAKSTVYNYYQSQLQQNINQQYPNLPESNRNTLMEKEWTKVYNQNKQQIETQVAQLSLQYKNQFKDDNNTAYLLGIDPYHYYRQAQLVYLNGYPGTEIKDGNPWDSFRLAPIGRAAEPNFHSWFGAFLYRIVHLSSDASFMTVFFYISTIFAALSIIPAFFIGKIITKNNVGGFFTAMLLAVSSFFVQRTTGESSDTDVYAVFFPVLIFWLFLEALEAKNLKHKLAWMTGAGFATGVFAYAWTGWWYIALFILLTLSLSIIYFFITERKWISLKELVTLGGIYLLVASIFVTIFTTFQDIFRMILGPFQFTNLKAVAVTTFWPNIRTTVAELNVPSFSNVIEQLDGKLLLFFAVLGIIFVFLRKNEQGKRDITIPFFLALWLASSLYATTKGIRFVLQITPVHSIALGAFIGLTWYYASQWISKELKLNVKITKIAVFILLLLLLIQPINSGYSQAYHSVSSMNDGWYNTLMKINHETPKESIITSWWDFGHWFKAIANRPVTFDGGTQVGYDAYWIGKSLLTSDEKLSTGIVHMLNCGQNTAFDELNKINNDTPKDIELLNKIITQNKNQAEKTLQEGGLTQEQANHILTYTHCDAPTDYYITSEDMIGKAGVWGHFGSWDFSKAVMYQKTHNLNRQDAINYLTTNFNLTPEQADKIHAEIQTTDADKWISPWPGYLSGLGGCDNKGNTLVCSINTKDGTLVADIELLSMNTSIRTTGKEKITPHALVYADKEGVKEKRFENSKLPFSIILLPENNKYQVLLADPTIAASTFTKLFFFKGHGMSCFQKFDEVQQVTSGKIITWAVDYNCKQENKVYFLAKEEVHVAHILISSQDKTPEEALKIITEIKKNITPKNFAEYAKKNSQDPGSKNNGGDLGWFGKGVMVPEFEKTAFSLKEGQISDPIRTQFGYHLLYLIGKRTS